MTARDPSIAIVGSGPSGCYAAQFLRKAFPGSEIVIFEALPVPYGLVRYGVAADHQGSKAVTDQFDRLFEREGVRFAGNLRIGGDLSFDALAAAFDIVVLATGLRDDRPLPIAIDADCRVMGAGAVIRALNGHPEVRLPHDADGRLLPLGKRIAVIGNGNVAIDVVRLLAKPEAQFHGSDIDDQRLHALRRDGIERIDVFGRSPVSAAKFDLSMFKEVLGLPGVRVLRSGTGDGEACGALDLLLSACDDPRHGHDATLAFHFGAVPVACRASDGATRLDVARAGSEVDETFTVDAVITAVGFTDSSGEGRGWTGDHVFRVGWLENGGKGAIAANRRSAKAVAAEIVAAIERGLPVGAPGFAALPRSLREQAVDFTGWRRVDRHERQLGCAARLRRKLTDLDHIIAIARDQTGIDHPGHINRDHGNT